MIHHIASTVCVLALASMASANLISNGDFASADNIGTGPDNVNWGDPGTHNQWWSNANWTYDAANQEVDKATGTSSNVVQFITMPAAGDYILSFDYNTTGSTYVRLIAFESPTNFYPVNNSTPFGSGWTTIYDTPIPLPTGDTSYSDTVSISAAQAYLAIQIRSFGGDTSASFDNVSLAVPEPASLALLGLGGVAMLRRRRA